MKSLFIDTCTNSLTVAITSDDGVLSLINSNNMKEHSKYALSSIQKVFEEAGIEPQEIDRIVVTNGPGSFTGVRIGVTIAKTFAWAAKKEVIPISSLLTYAMSYSDADYYVSLIDARRSCVFAAIYDQSYQPILVEKYISINELLDTIKSLKGSVLLTGNINIDGYEINPLKVDVLKTINYSKSIDSVNPHVLKPHYLKRVEAEEKLVGDKQ